jgi:AcrR family transcriptional regulator
MSAKQTKAKAGGKAPAQGKRAENKAKTRQAILKAALELFSQKGFYQATTKEIARKAGIAEGTIFNYFPTKEDLALCFFDQELGKLIEWFNGQERLQSAPLPEKLFAIIHRHLEQISPYEEFIGAVCLRALQPTSKLCPLSVERQELNLRYVRFIRELLAGAAQRGEIPQFGEVGPYGVGLFHLAMVVHWLRDPSPGKENTLALLDRCLKLALAVFQKKGGWEW